MAARLEARCAGLQRREQLLEMVQQARGLWAEGQRNLRACHAHRRSLPGRQHEPARVHAARASRLQSH